MVYEYVIGRSICENNPIAKLVKILNSILLGVFFRRLPVGSRRLGYPRRSWEAAIRTEGGLDAV